MTYERALSGLTPFHPRTSAPSASTRSISLNDAPVAVLNISADFDHFRCIDFLVLLCFLVGRVHEVCEFRQLLGLRWFSKLYLIRVHHDEC